MNRDRAQLAGSIGFLGFGNMGSAIFRGLVASGTITPKQAIAYDVDESKRTGASDAGARVASNPQELARDATILLLAPKPQDMEAALGSVGPDLSKETLLISIVAGISIQYIQSRLGEDARVVRVMPNTPAFVGAGAAGFALSENCGPEDAVTVCGVFEAIGVAEEVPEAAMDAVTALSGSGPAYFFYLVECLTKAAVELGLPKEQAARLAGQTLYGSGKLLAESGESASTLRERVTSKGGTTEAALERFGELGFESVVREAVRAAAWRSRELGK